MPQRKHKVMRKARPGDLCQASVGIRRDTKDNVVIMCKNAATCIYCPEEMGPGYPLCDDCFPKVKEQVEKSIEWKERGMGKEPLVTVVLPCHNHSRWVGLALASVRSQDYKNKRVIVIDDGSSDGSYDVVASSLSCLKVVISKDGEECGHAGIMSDGTPCVLLRSPAPNGPSYARNWGIKTLWEETELFAFLDSDDLYAPTKLSRSVERWSQGTRDIGAVYSDFDTLNAATGVSVRQYKEPFSNERHVRECLPNMDSLISKQALKTCGLFDESMRTCEDYDLWMRISEKYIILHIPEALVTVRVGNHSSTATVSKGVWEQNWQKVMDKARARQRQK